MFAAILSAIPSTPAHTPTNLLMEKACAPKNRHVLILAHVLVEFVFCGAVEELDQEHSPTKHEESFGSCCFVKENFRVS